MQANRKLGSYPSALITASLTIALFLIGFCGWVAVTSKELIKWVKERVEVQVHLDKDIAASRVDSLKTVLSKKPYVHGAIRYISQEEAAQLFFKDTKEDYRTVLPDNPFRDAFSLPIAEGYFSDSHLQEIAKDLEKIPGIYEADYPHDFVDGIAKNANRVYIIVASIVIIFLLATILLINNTIRLALYSQRFTIHTMQLVGATNAFVQRPFIYRGFRQGLLASVIAILLLLGFQQTAIWQVDGFNVLQNPINLGILAAILLILGPLLGMISTYASVSRYLSLDLDDLV